MIPCNPDSYCKRFAMASPNPVSDERKMKDKDKTKLAKIKNPRESYIPEMAFPVENNSSSGQLLISNLLLETRLFRD
jgi:hypothetical protein